MIALKKTHLFVLCILVSSFSYGQRTADIGFQVSTMDKNRMSLDYRKFFNEKYGYRVGAIYGHSGFVQAGRPQIIEATDSTVILRSYVSQSLWGGLKFGVERRMSNPIFSVAGDLIVFYQNKQEEYRSETFIDSDTAGWVHDGTYHFPHFSDPTSSRITRHFVEPSLWLSFNIEAPLGDRFYFDLSLTSGMGIPIYMGATSVFDAEDKFIGTPPSTINFESGLTAGIRYRIGK